VGVAGTIVHWDGVKWSLAASGTTEDLEAVWGSSSSDVWAVGLGGTIVHWNGARWSPVPSGTPVDLVDLSGSGPDDVWAVGSLDRSQPTILPDAGRYVVHWDGKSWSTVSLGIDAYVTGVWASGPTDAWAVGGGGTILHWDGAQWSEVTRLDTHPHGLTGIWASGPRDVRVYGDAHEFHFDGQTWAREDFGADPFISRVAGTGPDDVWAVGARLGVEAVDLYHFDGTSWTKATDRAPFLHGAWATSSADAWAVGFGGQIVHWDGRAWTLADEDLTAGSPTFGSGPATAVWGSGPDDVWTVESGVSLHWDGRMWTKPASGPAGNVYGLWGSGPDDVWGVGTDGNQPAIVHWDGRTWTSTLPARTAYDLSYLAAVWGSGPRDVWAVGGASHARALLCHWDGATWSLDDTMMGSLGSVWGSGPNDVWVAGGPSADAGTVLHFDGTAWSTVMSNQQRLFGPIWGTSAHDVWLAGRQITSQAIEIGELHHWDGSSWAIVDDAPKHVLRSLWGAAADDVWAIGTIADERNPNYRLAFLHFDGKTWTAAAPRRSGFEFVVGALWGSGPGDVWAVGANAILHHAGP
jgi:hypothetical protein